MAFLLVVDDNEDLCRVMARTLRRLGHEVATFSSGVDALEFLREPVNPLPDLMILDYMMPDRDGLDVLRDLRSGLRGSEILVAMFTANDDPEVATLAREAGANDFWVKSRMDLHAIDQRVRSLLSIYECNVAPLLEHAAA